MSRKIIGMICALFLALALPVMAQDQEDPDFESPSEFEKSKEEFGKRDEPGVSIKIEDEDEKTEAKAGWGGYGGPLGAYLVLDLSPLDPMTKDRGLDGFDGNLILPGGLGGFTYYPPDKKGYWYIGGTAFGLTQRENDYVAGFERRAKMELTGGGVFIEHRSPVSSRLDLALGALIGGGSLLLKAEGQDLGLPAGDDWSETASFALANPYAGFSYAVTDWMRVEATAGYMIFEADLSGSKYTINASNMDMTDGNVTGGPMASLRVVFGWGKRQQ